MPMLGISGCRYEMALLIVPNMSALLRFMRPETATLRLERGLRGAVCSMHPTIQLQPINRVREVAGNATRFPIR